MQHRTWRNLLNLASVMPSPFVSACRTMWGYNSCNAENKEHRPQRASKSSGLLVCFVIALENARAASLFSTDEYGGPIQLYHMYCCATDPKSQILSEERSQKSEGTFRYSLVVKCTYHSIFDSINHFMLLGFSDESMWYLTTQ
jgi:hypothetical protein